MGANEISLLFIGWLLGLLSPIIINAIQERGKASKLQQSILSEIDEFRITMAALVYRVASNVNALNHELIEYLLPIYEASNSVKEYDGIFKGLREMQKLTPEQLHYAQEQQVSHRFLSVKKYDLPYLRVKVNELSSLDDDFQRKSFELLTLIDIFNEEIDESRFFHRLTFDENISLDKQQEIAEQLMSNYQTISRRAKIILEKIDAF